MSFCKFSTSRQVKNYTEISNIFFVDYMADAPDNFTKIYLYGLYLCQNSENNNSVEQFEKYFGLSKEDIYGAFAYWQERGLVKVVEIEPFEIRYLEIVRNYDIERQVLNGKYKDFCRDIQEIISGRMLTINELKEYMDFLSTHNMKENALLAIAHYCAQTQGLDIGYKYVLTVARNWLSKGVTTQKDVVKHIENINKKVESLDVLLKIFGINRPHNIDELNSFNLITKELDFPIDIVYHVAKNLKTKSRNAMLQLENKMKQYYEMRLTSIAEIDQFESQRDYLFDCAKEIVKELGRYYENLEPVVQNYIIKWHNLGFEQTALKQIALYCFKMNISSLDGMDEWVNKFFKLGLISLEAINAYIAQTIEIDNQIKLVLDKLGVVRKVNSADRHMYNLWINTYNISEELMNFAIEKAMHTIQPMQYLNKVLHTYHINNISTPQEAQERDLRFNLNNLGASDKDKAKNKNKQKNSAENLTQNAKQQMFQREYTADEISALFTNIDDIKF